MAKCKCAPGVDLSHLSEKDITAEQARAFCRDYIDHMFETAGNDEPCCRCSAHAIRAFHMLGDALRDAYRLRGAGEDTAERHAEAATARLVVVIVVSAMGAIFECGMDRELWDYLCGKAYDECYREVDRRYGIDDVPFKQDGSEN